MATWPRATWSHPRPAPGPGVLVIQEWWGLDSGIKEMADRLGAAGFVALAPDLYHGELAGARRDGQGGASDAEPAARRGGPGHERRRRLPGEPPAVTGDGIGVVGFCMGGMLSFIIAANRPDKVKAVVPFYGFPQGDDRARLVEADGVGQRAHGRARQLLPSSCGAGARSQAARDGQERHPDRSSGTGHAFMAPAQCAGHVQRAGSRSGSGRRSPFLQTDVVVTTQGDGQQATGNRPCGRWPVAVAVFATASTIRRRGCWGRTPPRCTGGCRRRRSSARLPT